MRIQKPTAISAEVGFPLGRLVFNNARPDLHSGMRVFVLGDCVDEVTQKGLAEMALLKVTACWHKRKA